MKNMAMLPTFLVVLALTLLQYASAQWEPTNGPLSHSPIISSFVTLGSDYLVHAGAQDGSLSGLFRSTDKGLTWNYFPSPHGQGLLFVNGYTLLSFEETRYPSGYTSGLFRSTDKGMTWESASIDLGTAYISCFCALGGISLRWNVLNSGVFRCPATMGRVWKGDGNGELSLWPARS